jgi:hypothetical protein
MAFAIIRNDSSGWARKVASNPMRVTSDAPSLPRTTIGIPAAPLISCVMPAPTEAPRVGGSLQTRRETP